MSRGGRGGGRGGKRGPDMSWQDEDPEEPSQQPMKRVPEPLYPTRELPTPRPLSVTEKSGVKALLNLRDRIRNGPLYTVLEPSTLLDDKGKANPRAGFDPFNDQEQFTKRYHRKRRTVPDLTERGGYTLRLFPIELWPVLDPKKRQRDYWDTLPEEAKARLSGQQRSTKRKRTEKLNFTDTDLTTANDAASNASNSASDSDTILNPSSRRKRTAEKTRRERAAEKSGKQKKGLDAEDDYPDVEQQDQNEDAEAANAEEEPQDSEFGTDEDEDDGADDYNAEQYFDDGEGDDFGDGGDDEGGGGGGEWYS